jgi:hypothetical protein
MYDRQHGVESNLFLAPGEGDDGGEPEGAEPAGAGRRGSTLGLIDP